MNLEPNVCYLLKILIINYIVFDIAEETENYDLVPKWKKRLVQQRLKYMITGGEDDGAIDEALLDATGTYKLGAVLNKGA